MEKNIDLKEIEKKAWTSYFEDGLWDVFMGLMMLTMGIRALTDNVWFTLMIFAAVLVGPLGKKFITIPRIGLVKFGPARKVKQKKLVAVLIISVLAITALLLLLHSGLALSKTLISPIMAIWIAVVFSLLAYFLDFGRLYAYGLLFATSEVLWGLFGKPIGPIAHTVFGTVILLIGLAYFIRFLRKYPLPEEVSND